MCGITGVFAFSPKGKNFFDKIGESCHTLEKRGPDGGGTFSENNVALGHRRLAVIDTSNAAAQPFTDESGRYVIVFNGEFFNYLEHRTQLESAGVKFRTTSDTEVLLHLFSKKGMACIEDVNGFFAFAVYDKKEEVLYLARDRAGIKPLFIYQDEDAICFASEMKALMAYGIEREIDFVSLNIYLQLNYIPAPQSIFKNVRKLKAGHYLEIRKKNIVEKEYYQIPFHEDNGYPEEVNAYSGMQKKLRELMDRSVERRLVSDVPLGAFLSGGLDSSVIVALAAQKVPHLKTFSIGYKDEVAFDETEYAKLVADKYNTDHTIFYLTNDDLFSNLHEVLEYIDEPFADSSALPLYILSKETAKHVTVSLSGDGADELFGGYNKHGAELIARTSKFSSLLKFSAPFLDKLPKSRQPGFGNRIRQLHRFAEGMRLSPQDRYWRWCAFVNESDATALLLNCGNETEYNERKKEILKHIHGEVSLNDILYTDMQLVLQNDMLVKVDMMSMANSLEVRTPFLDYEVVNFAFSTPSVFKLDRVGRKKILADAFKSLLPEKIITRKKQGFEVPLLQWFRKDLRMLIEKELLNDEFITEQKIFNLNEIRKLKVQMFSKDPGEVHAQIWGLIVFQYWWKKYIGVSG